jgi:hypothetical protein
MRLRFIFFIIEIAPFTYPQKVRCGDWLKGNTRVASFSKGVRWTTILDWIGGVLLEPFGGNCVVCCGASKKDLFSEKLYWGD